MRGIVLDVNSRNAYHVSDYMITLVNKKRTNWPNEWRFISAASQARLIRLWAKCDTHTDILALPLNDEWYCTNQDRTVITFVWG